MTEVVVVILNYNGCNFLRQFLPSVIAHSAEAKIIVADNASTDDSIEILEKEFNQAVEIIKLNENYGFCGGYNRALKLIDAEYYVLLNSDVEVTPNWISPILKLFKTDSTIAAAQPKILSYHKKDLFEYAGAAGGYIDTLGFPFCRGRIFNHIEKDSGQYDDTRPIFWATGACLFIRSSAYHECGGLDEDFFAHMEEIDLCWHLNRAGNKVYYVGESVVYHVGGGTLSKSNPRKTFLNFRNGLSLLIKHTPATMLWWKLPLRIILDWTAMMKFFLQGAPQDSWAVVKAHIQFITRLASDFKKRGKLKNKKLTNPIAYQYPGLLVVDFYIYRKKIFKNLGWIQ